MPVGYDFDRDTPDHQGEGSGSRIRVIVIFLVILAVTGAILWFVIPRNGGSEAGKTLPVEVPKEGVAPADDASASRAAGEVDRAAVKSGAEVTALPVDGSETKETDGDPAAPEETPATPETPTAEPEKGREWVGDIPASQDIPAVASGSGTTEQQRTLALLRAAAVGKWSAADLAAAEQLVAALPENSADYREAGKLLAELNRRNLFESGAADGGVVLHRVAPGNNLSRLARHYHTTVEALRTAGGLKNNVLQVGRKLRVMPGPWKIAVEKSTRLLKLYRKDGANWKLWGVYEVGIGRLDRTPTADFVISARLRHPTWYAPGGVVYKYGEPGNVLGDYFLKLAASGTPDRPLNGYGIHGTAHESDVNRSISNGCIRMRNREVEIIYLLAPAGTPVEIRN